MFLDSLLPVFSRKLPETNDPHTQSCHQFWGSLAK